MAFVDGEVIECNSIAEEQSRCYCGSDGDVSIRVVRKSSRFLRSNSLE